MVIDIDVEEVVIEVDIEEGGGVGIDVRLDVEKGADQAHLCHSPLVCP